MHPSSLSKSIPRIWAKLRQYIERVTSIDPFRFEFASSPVTTNSRHLWGTLSAWNIRGTMDLSVPEWHFHVIPCTCRGTSWWMVAEQRNKEGWKSWPRGRGKEGRTRNKGKDGERTVAYLRGWGCALCVDVETHFSLQTYGGDLLATITITIVYRVIIGITIRMMEGDAKSIVERITNITRVKARFK